MAFYKCTFFFEMGKRGWSETWYRDEESTDDALLKAVLLAGRRVPLLGSQGTGAGSPKLTVIRVSDVAVQRDSLIWQAPSTGQEAAWPTETYGSDHPEVALLVRANSGDKYRRSVWMHGQPDLLWKNEGFVRDALWFQRFDQWESTLIQQQWKIRVIDKLVVTRKVLAITRPAVGSNPVTLQIDPGSTLADGVKIRLSGVYELVGGRKIPLPLNREWLVIAVGAQEIQLQGSNNFTLPTAYFGGATLKPQQITFANVTACVPREIRTRECGLPFDTSPGRRRQRGALAQ